MEVIIGERYRIRSWDDMVDEFGLDRDGDIELRNNDFFYGYFYDEMRYLCGKAFTVRSVSPNLESFEDVERRHDRYKWHIVPQMLEPMPDSKAECNVGSSLSDMFGG